MLPWLVTYGAYAWKLAIALAVLLGLGIVRAVRRRAEAQRARAEVAPHVARATAPVLAQAEGVVTLTGTLHDGIVTTLAIEGGDRRHDRRGELWLDYRGDRVELVGDVDVVRGTAQTVTRRHPRSAPSTIVRTPGRRVHRLTSVRDGDAVIVTGTVAPPAAKQPVDRFGRRRWVLEVPTDRPAIQLVATNPVVTAVPLPWLARLAIAIAIGAASWGGLYALGRHELARGVQEATDAAVTARESPALGLGDPLVLATALPGSRERALLALDRRYASRYRVTAVTLEQRRALRHLLGCTWEVDLLGIVERYDDMLAAADACGEHGAATWALVQLGRYDEAATRAITHAGDVDPGVAVRAAIAAGKWTDAARLAASQECVALLLRLRGGDASAADRLHALAARDRTCQLADALAQPAERRRAALAAITDLPALELPADPATLAPPTYRDSMWSPAACDAEAGAAFAAAKAGDGGPLAGLMLRCALRFTDGAPRLVEVLPHVTRDRDALLERARMMFDLGMWRDAAFQPARTAALHVQLATLAGDAAAAARWKAILDRHVAALGDRDRAAALALWAYSRP